MARKAPGKKNSGAEICILAGGLSKRMGRDKSRLRLGRRSLLNIIRSTAEESGLPVRVIRKDCVPRCGPLGGILTALTTSRTHQVLFLACDMPFVTPDLLNSLLRSSKASSKRGRQPGALFVLHEGHAGFPFLIDTRHGETVWKEIQAKRLSLQNLARVLKARTIRVPPRWQAQLENLNTPVKWACSRRRWQEEKRELL